MNWCSITADSNRLTFCTNQSLHVRRFLDVSIPPVVNLFRQRSNCSTVHSIRNVWGLFLHSEVWSVVGLVNSLKFGSLIVHLRFFFFFFKPNTSISSKHFASF